MKEYTHSSNRRENTETDPHKYSQLNFDIRAKIIQQRKETVFSKTCAATIRYLNAKEKEHKPSAVYKNYLNYIKVLNMRGKNIKHLE